MSRPCLVMWVGKKESESVRTHGTVGTVHVYAKRRYKRNAMMRRVPAATRRCVFSLRLRARCYYGPTSAVDSERNAQEGCGQDRSYRVAARTKATANGRKNKTWPLLLLLSPSSTSSSSTS